MEIGAQFYTVRELCKTPEAFADTLARVAEIGYKNVQISGTCPYEAEWLKEELRKNGLRCVLTHIPADKLVGQTDQVIADHHVFGSECIGLGWYSFDEEKGETYDKFLETYLPVAQKIREGGRYFMYHNHDQEFKRIGGKLIIEKLAEDIPADTMGFTVDTFWVQAGGADPAKIVEMLSGRIPCIHLKDFSYGRKMAVVGEGNINFERVFEKALAGGTKYMLVEQDNCNGEDPLECLRRSYNYLHALGFE